MSSITALFGNTAEKSGPEDERLLDLYWNRNALKKEFAGLRNEKFKLTDRLKVQQGDFARLQQKLEHLEQLLVEPDWARSVLVLYQLRGLASRCRSRISVFAEQIKQQQEQKQHGALLANWRAGIQGETDQVRAEIRSLQEQAATAAQEIQAAEQEHAKMGTVVRLFRGRSLRDRVARLHSEIEELEVQVRNRQQSIAEAESREPPEVVGLSIATKRSINLMILAYAQILFLSHEDDALATLAKEACDKSAGAVRYGSDDECEAIIRRIRRSSARLASGKDCAEELQKRARLIGEGAMFGGDDDAVPMPGSVATIVRTDSLGNVTSADANLLGQNYWNITATLSR